MVLQKLVGNIYSVVMEIVLWLLPIAGFIACGILFAGRHNDFHIGYAFLGLLSGLILDVLLFAPVIVLLNMRSSLKNIESLVNGKSSLGSNENSIINNDWVCKRCGKTNRNTALFCNGCGEKK